MIKRKKSLYILISTLLFAAYVWLFLNHQSHEGTSTCLFKNIFHIPCPSCGVTRAILLITGGDFMEGVMTNPLSIVVLLGLLCLPVLIFLDVLFRKNYLFQLYNYTEKAFRSSIVYIPFIIIIFVNWLWNIHKQL